MQGSLVITEWFGLRMPMVGICMPVWPVAPTKNVSQGILTAYGLLLSAQVQNLQLAA